MNHEQFFTQHRNGFLEHTFGGRVPDQIFDLRQGAMVAYAPQRANIYRWRGLQNLARECFAHFGIPRDVAFNAPNHEIASSILSGRASGSLGIVASSDGAAFNATGAFSNILRDAANVTLRDGDNEAPTTFDAWAGRGPAVSDFKTVNRVISGEIGDPKMIPEDGEFDESTFIDGKETYRLNVWGQMFSLTWQAMVNDSDGAFKTIIPKLGRSMRRKENKLVYQVLKDNAALSGGTALFHADRLNLTTGTATPTVATLNTMSQKLSEQTGLNADAVLNLEPKFLLAPPALRGTVLELLASTANPAASGNSGVKNVWENAVEPVIDALLGADAGGSDTAWYLNSDPLDCQTVEYAYLEGLENPVIESTSAFSSLAMKWRIYHAFATAALDHRGMQKHNGV